MKSSWLTPAFLLLLSTSSNAQTSPPKYPAPYGDGHGDWASAYAKARTFVGKLTLTEKVNLTTGVGWEQELCVGNTGSIPRLGFRSLCLQDSPLGVRLTDGNSAFPAGLNAAATWDRRLLRSRGDAMGAEHRAKGVDILLGPVAGPLGRVPAGGRNWEGFSPDPVLTGVAMSETIKGIQGQGVVACAKHFILNEQEHFRDSGSFNAEDATMHETYLWPFADAVKAGAGSIMCSYNRVNGSYACQNSYILNYLLKNELDFQGFVMSDWAAQHSGVASALAGMDMTMPGDIGFGDGNTFWGSWLTQAVLNGTVPQWRIDDMATRIMAAWYYVGRDSAAVPINFSSWTLNTMGYQHNLVSQDYRQVNYHVDVQGNHKALIREIGAKSTVLLKNTNNALPLKKPKTIAVVGMDARDTPGGPNACGDRGCNTGTLAMGWGSGTANFPYLISPLTALQARVTQDGTTLKSSATDGNFALARSVATGADAALVFVNADSGENYITVAGNAGDRNNLTLWGAGEDLIAAVAAVNKNTIVVMHTVGPVLVESFKNNPNVTGILWAGLPGQESGNALVDVLYGAVNPGAKSPFTWGKAREDWGVDVLYTANGNPAQINLAEGNFIDYKSFDRSGKTPSYEFGFGLSYTTFKYANLVVAKQSAPAYTPASGKQGPAPTFSPGSKSPSEYAFPAGFNKVSKYIYPFLANANAIPSGTPDASIPAGALDGSGFNRAPAGGAPGGNLGLYDVLYKVSATITNTGYAAGDEVVQLYVNLGGPKDAKVALRNFDRLSIPAGGSATFSATLTRRDLSNWNPATQNWEVSSYKKTVYVGSSSRTLLLSAVLT